MGGRRTAWITFLTLAVGAGAASSTPVGEPATLHLIWNDHYRLLHCNTLACGGFRELRAEVDRIFAEAQVEVRWSRGDRARPSIPSPAIRVILVPSNPESWALPPGTMGAVLGGPKSRRSVYIFFPAVLRTWGEANPFSSRFRSFSHVSELARATGRVVAHELVHAICPALPHAKKGLMRDRLDRPALRRSSLRLTRTVAARFRQRLSAGSSRSER